MFSQHPSFLARWTAAAAASLLLSLIACSPPPPAKAQQGSQDEPGRWAFVTKPDDFSPNALLDLRFLNEKVAGESGFVTMDENGDFRLGNGKPVRFWAVNTNVGREKPYKPRPQWRRAEPDLARHARFLAKRGVNMVRLHTHVNPNVKAHPNARIRDVNAAERDWIWRTVAAMKKEGIYTTISPYWANTMELSPTWNVPGGANQSVHGLLFFDEMMQDAYKAWLRALYAETNPYSGVPLAQDAAVAVIQLQNEDSLLFWTVNNIKGESRLRLGRKCGDWLKKKYGSLGAAFAAWQGDKLPGDDPAAGVVDFHNIWEMTQNRSGGRAKRLDDQLQFWAEAMFAFNKTMADFLRNELGCKHLINAGNWKTADMVRLNDAERWSYTANEVLAVNHYVGGLHVGQHQGWAIIAGDQFTSPSVLFNPRELPINLKQAKGRPMMVTESAWVMPNGYATEGPFLVSVYQSLTGVDAFYWFATGDDEWTPPQSANGYLPSQQKWMFGNPDMMGNFPAAALMFRMGYVQRGAPAVVEERALADLWQRRTPVISEESSFDPNRDAGNIAPTSNVKRALPPETFLVGPVEVRYGGDPSKTFVTDLSRYFDPNAKIIRSITGEVTLDYGKGYCLLDAPCAQGVAAHFKNQNRFRTRDVEIVSGNDFGAVYVVAMDGKPVASSSRLLVQVGTQSRPTGWREAPAVVQVREGTFQGYRVENYGSAPWQVVRANVTLTIANASVRKATVLDVNGNPIGNAPLEKSGNGVRLKFPETAMYVMVE